MNRLIIATRNRGKSLEIKKILRLGDIEMFDLNDISFERNIEERGEGFLENALIKAKEVYGFFGIPVLADDSGLVVPYLDGRPGIYSSRFAGPAASDSENNALLISLLSGAVGEQRRAWFFCAAVFYMETGKYIAAEGRLDGYIASEPAGGGGFGYDPLFYLPDCGLTAAQLSEDEKNRISHRARAILRLKPVIESCLSL